MSPTEAVANSEGLMGDSSQSFPRLQTIHGSQKGSWVNAVEGSKVLKKYDVEVKLIDGMGSVEVPEEVFQDASPLLIGKFLERVPHIAKVHAIVNKIWALSDKSQMIDVFEVNSTTMKFRIANPTVRNRILKRGMWNLAQVPVVMSKWTPMVEDAQPAMQSIPLWVHLRNVPMDMYSWKGLSFVASPVGVPDRLHPETAQCLNLKVAKIFVKADLTKPLPKKMSFNFHGKETVVEYTFPWLPSKCSNCDKWGHSVKACLAAPKGLTEETMEKINVVEVDQQIDVEKDNGSMELSVEQTKMEGKGQERELVNDLVQEAHYEGTKNNDVGKYIESETDSVEKGWSEVHPSKASRTPSPKKNSEHEQLSILSKTRFSVLSLTEEEDKEDDEQKVVEKEEEGEIEDKEDEVNTVEHVTDGVRTEEGEIVDGSADSTDVHSEHGIEISTEATSDKISQEQEVTLRQSLPRGSKNNHKYLSDVSVQKQRDVNPSGMNKKKTRKTQ